MSRHHLARFVRRLPQRRSWTQARLAAIAHLSIRTVQRLEDDGHCAPETLLAVAAAFDMDFEELTTTLYRPNRPHRPRGMILGMQESLKLAHFL